MNIDKWIKAPRRKKTLLTTWEEDDLLELQVEAKRQNVSCCAFVRALWFAYREFKDERQEVQQEQQEVQDKLDSMFGG